MGKPNVEVRQQMIYLLPGWKLIGAFLSGLAGSHTWAKFASKQTEFRCVVSDIPIFQEYPLVI